MVKDTFFLCMLIKHSLHPGGHDDLQLAEALFNVLRLLSQYLTLSLLPLDLRLTSLLFRQLILKGLYLRVLGLQHG